MFFFFSSRRRHTRSDRDWSSDVCSSDLENVLYKDGKVINANMTNCIVPTFADAPDLETVIVEIPYPFGPSGAKGVGEIPMDGPAAAVANAVEDALGVPFDALPISPEAIAASR